MRALVLCDDYWHPACTPRAGLQPFAEAGWAFEWIENAGGWSAASQMTGYSVVVLTKANNISSSDRRPWVTPDIEAALRAYVRAGNGLLVIHSGAAGYDALPIMRGLLGGAFQHHPPQCLVTLEPQAGHPLTAGSPGCTVFDEHYFMVLDDDQAEVFLATRSAHGTQPGGWTRQEGAGRVCVLTPGHNLAVWRHPAYQALIGNALAWCTGAIP